MSLSDPMTFSDSHEDSEEPPFKKRRFFADKSNFLEDEASLPDETELFSTPADSSDLNGSLALRDSDGANESARAGFDAASLEAFIGEKISVEDIEILRDASGNDLERAVNMYFDGTWKARLKKAMVPSRNATVENFAKSQGPPRAASTRTDTPATPVRHLSMPPFRYVGAFGVNGWATRSGISLIKHGETVRIERQKIQPPKPTTVKRGRSVVTIAPRGSTAAARRVDVIVRFTNSKGEEVGRLPKETANWVSVLMDQKVCKFEGICVYAPERVRTNDTIFLQLRCSILRSAFDNHAFKLADNRTTGLFEEKETSEEKDLRLRQVALVKLFEEINLLPSRTTEATAKSKRKGLLQAADVAEQYEKEGGKKEKDKQGDNVASPSPSEEEEGQELEQDQLDALYKKAQSYDWDAPEAEPAETFAMDLRPYQKQALYWMMAKERDEKNREVSMHPLWEEYMWPKKDMDDKDVPEVAGQESFYVNPYSGELSLGFPVQEQNCLGGILADEMGLGKTIEMMSLIHSHKSDVAMNLKSSTSGPSTINSLPRLPNKTSSIERAPLTTLVVAPMSLLAQWECEAQNASKDGTMKTIVYYGSDKAANLQTLCCEANAKSVPRVVITSYGVLLSEFGQVAAKNGDRGSHGGLYSLKFFRVILDEAHGIKNRLSKTAKACYEIAAEHRWVLTGTPIVNRLEDLFSLVRFLRVEPWNNFSFWKTFITVPFESKDFMRALDVVQTVLEPLVLRRTKNMKLPNGEALVPLPSKTVDIVEVELSKPEREVYDYIFTRARRNFAASVEAGTVLRSYTSIFAQILRLRQSCCHPVLTRNKDIVADEEDAAEAADAENGLADDMDLAELIEKFTASSDDADAHAFGAHVLEQIRDEALNECPICLEEPMFEQTVTGCWHSACKKCLLDHIAHQVEKGTIPRCLTCREPINSHDVFEVVKQDDDDVCVSEQPKITLQRIGSNSSAKIGALLSHLKALRKEFPGTKSVVFSQFTSFLSLIEPALTRASIPFLRLDGSMSQKNRAAVLSEFASSTNTKGTVLLLSLRAGGVGLNLTMAKRVFMMDPWWSFAIEAQAIDRVHRMGQTDEVKVVRFIVANSVEQRMLKIQDRKKFIGSALGMMSDEEKKLQRIDDIKDLLS